MNICILAVQSGKSSVNGNPSRMFLWNCASNKKRFQEGSLPVELGHNSSPHWSLAIWRGMFSPSTKQAESFSPGWKLRRLSSYDVVIPNSCEGPLATHLLLGSNSHFGNNRKETFVGPLEKIPDSRTSQSFGDDIELQGLSSILNIAKYDQNVFESNLFYK